MPSGDEFASLWRPGAPGGRTAPGPNRALAGAGAGCGAGCPAGSGRSARRARRRGELRRQLSRSPRGGPRRWCPGGRQAGRATARPRRAVQGGLSPSAVLRSACRAPRPGVAGQAVPRPASGCPGGWWALVALAALAGAGGRRGPGPDRAGGPGAAPAVRTGATSAARTAREHRGRPDGWPATGDYAAAILEWVRAIAADLDERGVLAPDRADGGRVRRRGGPRPAAARRRSRSARPGCSTRSATGGARDPAGLRTAARPGRAHRGRPPRRRGAAAVAGRRDQHRPAAARGPAVRRAPAGPGGPDRRPVLSGWRRWRAPVAVMLVILLGGLIVALLQAAAGTGHLDPGNPPVRGARAGGAAGRPRQGRGAGPPRRPRPPRWPRPAAPPWSSPARKSCRRGSWLAGPRPGRAAAGGAGPRGARRAGPGGDAWPGLPARSAPCRRAADCPARAGRYRGPGRLRCAAPRPAAGAATQCCPADGLRHWCATWPPGTGHRAGHRRAAGTRTWVPAATRRSP